MNDDGGNCAAGRIGHFPVKGDSFLPGYPRMAQMHRGKPTAEGCIMTDDAGFLSADGQLVFLSRAGDCRIAGGYNVYPKEIEIEISGIAAVARAAVIGVPHPECGEAVTAIVVLRRGFEALREPMPSPGASAAS